MGRLALKTCQSDGVSDEVPSKDVSSVGRQNFQQFRDVVGQSAKQVIIRRTLAYGVKYGIGVFCFLETEEQQIGWVPENDKNTLKFVEKAC